MKKISILFLVAAVCFAFKSNGQKTCGTDENHKRLIAEHPEILKIQADLESQIQNGLKKIDLGRAAKTTFTDESGNLNFWYDVPIVVHFVHDYGSEYKTDDDVFNDAADWNLVYAKLNHDTSLVIPTWVPYIGNPHIRLHLATIDPSGQPSKGITRRRSYLTYYGGEEAKMDDWPPASYVNIWVVNTMSPSNFEAAAYAFFPADGAGDPYGDGIICLSDYLANAYDGSPNSISKTINHEMGHVMNLQHPWGTTNSPAVACGDDGVDDTPPTMGHLPSGCVNSALYDTTCAVNYYKVYTDISGHDSLVNYPDTTNAQNIMDYTYCARMFTKGQAARMHAALNNDVAGRSNLWDSTNLALTGALVPRPDYPVKPDFCATNTIATGSNTYRVSLNYFTFPNSNVTFHNESYNDTIESITWTFSNGATIPSVTYDSAQANNTVVNQFTQSGWVNLSISAKGNNTATADSTWPRAVFVSSTSATPGASVFQDFNGADTVNWPTFNYYGNEFKWQYSNIGMYDNASLEYVGFDSRVNTTLGIVPFTGSPLGDVDDFFTIPVDLSGFSGACYLNYEYSGASRSSNPPDINDTMEIDYAIKTSSGAMSSWIPITYLSQGSLDNKGGISTSWTPSSPSDWAPMGIYVPASAKSTYTVFRFRYRPSVAVGFDHTVNTGSVSSGNNFYMDRLTFSQWPASVANVLLGNLEVAVVPNPTSGDAYVVVKDANSTSAEVIVSDITGKMVYSTTDQIVGGEAHIQIPRASISVPGMYMVQATSGGQTTTRKLVVQ